VISSAENCVMTQVFKRTGLMKNDMGKTPGEVSGATEQLMLLA